MTLTLVTLVYCDQMTSEHTALLSSTILTQSEWSHVDRVTSILVSYSIDHMLIM